MAPPLPASTVPAMLSAGSDAVPWTAASIVSVVFLGWYAFIWSFSLLGLYTARRLFLPPIATSPLSSLKAPDQHSSGAEDSPGSSTAAPGVSILRPLAGLDHNLFSNLASAFEQRYPSDSFEIILSVKNEQDQALEVARQVVARYPHVKSRVVVGDEQAGVNPKVNNLVIPYSLAAFDILWVLDAQCSLPPTALGRAVDALTRTPPPIPAPQALRRLSLFGGAAYAKGSTHRVGLVHHVPLAVSPGTGLGSQVEHAFLCTNHAKMYLAINSLSVDSCVMGKSNLWRKSDLERVPDSFFGVGESGTGGERGAIGSAAFSANEDGGGAGGVSTGASRALAKFSIYLAEDNMLALSLWRAPMNLHHTISPGDAVRTSVGDINSLGDYARRRMRWIRVRYHMTLGATFTEPLTESIVAGSMAAFALWHLLLPTWLGRSPIWGFNLDSSALILFALLHEVAWHTVDAGVMYAMRGGDHLPPGETMRFRLAWLLREVLALPIWLCAVLGSEVTWRGQRFKVLPDGRAARCKDSQSGWFGGRRAGRAQYERLPAERR